MTIQRDDVILIESVAALQLKFEKAAAIALYKRAAVLYFIIRLESQWIEFVKGLKRKSFRQPNGKVNARNTIGGNLKATGFEFDVFLVFGVKNNLSFR